MKRKTPWILLLAAIICQFCSCATQHAGSTYYDYQYARDHHGHYYRDHPKKG